MSLAINDSEFINDNSTDYGTEEDPVDIRGGILYLTDLRFLRISNSKFEGMNIADEGGAIYIQRLALPVDDPIEMVITN